MTLPGERVLALRVVEWCREMKRQRFQEATGKNDGPPSVRFMGGRQEPWCGHFVACGFRECGAPLPFDVVPSPKVANPLAGVQFMEDVTKKRGWWHPGTAGIAPGDILFLLTRGLSDTGPGRHVAIVEQALPTSVITVDGNWGHMVGSAVRALSDKQISGYARVPDPLKN